MNEEKLINNSVLWPFLPALAEIKHRLCGIEVECEPLGLSFDKDVQTEEDMLLTLISQKAFVFDVTNENGVVWDIRREPFSQFKARSTKITFPFTGYNPNKRQQISNWVIELCNWEGDVFTGITRH
ncbi:hypothetical protein [Aliiglaciecola sp. LCG003]|uniref:hypothetical protein n=1 Tax=Aliiglaciecola sp. LCG003 TaxID=3053655 RepID=UPI002572C61F|nr:hypothetical protein [Aliiglaciecola sp. LCG003]WJG09392.1 hypothetical protein QR722_19015 [Aliiglaciecola sp. LCG003]